MEGLLLGLMRLGTIVGMGLPKKSPVSVGAGGATISGSKFIHSGESLQSEISPVRDECSITVPEETKEIVIEALEKAGAFADRCHGQVHQRKTYNAFTYREK